MGWAERANPNSRRNRALPLGGYRPYPSKPVTLLTKAQKVFRRWLTALGLRKAA